MHGFVQRWLVAWGLMAWVLLALVLTVCAHEHGHAPQQPGRHHGSQRTLITFERSTKFTLAAKLRTSCNPCSQNTKPRPPCTCGSVGDSSSQLPFSPALSDICTPFNARLAAEAGCSVVVLQHLCSSCTFLCKPTYKSHRIYFQATIQWRSSKDAITAAPECPRWYSHPPSTSCTTSTHTRSTLRKLSPSSSHWSITVTERPVCLHAWCH